MQADPSTLFNGPNEAARSAVIIAGSNIGSRRTNAGAVVLPAIAQVAVFRQAAHCVERKPKPHSGDPCHAQALRFAAMWGWLARRLAAVALRAGRCTEGTLKRGHTPLLPPRLCFEAALSRLPVPGLRLCAACLQDACWFGLCSGFISAARVRGTALSRCELCAPTLPTLPVLTQAFRCS